MSHEGFDREKESINLARLKKGGHVFEVSIDSDKAVAYRGGSGELRDVLNAESIFSDAKKGLLAPEGAMTEMFGTTETMEVAEIILKKGEIQLTAEYRKKLREEKIKRIIDIIHRNGVDPRTHAPHPHTRIESAIEQANVKIDDYKSAEDQLQDVMHALKPILPIRFEVKEIQLTIGKDHAPKLYSVVKSFGKLHKDQWLQDGSWLVVVEIPAGIEQDMYDKLNSMTHGDIDAKVLSTK